MPTDAELFRLAREGWTHAEIRAECERASGRLQPDFVVSAALMRGAANAGEHRLFETVPWRVLPVYQTRFPVRRLRSLGIRRACLPQPESQEAVLDAWLEVVRRERVIVVYCPLTDAGFHYVDESMRGGPNADVPVRVQVVRWLEELPVREIDDGRPDEPGS